MEAVRLNLKITTCYLIRVEDGYLFMDTGCERYKDLFYKRLEKLHIGIADSASVLLTHHHDDHSGQINEIKTRNPSCRVIMHSKAIPRRQRGKDDLAECKYAAVFGTKYCVILVADLDQYYSRFASFGVINTPFVVSISSTLW